MEGQNASCQTRLKPIRSLAGHQDKVKSTTYRPGSVHSFKSTKTTNNPFQEAPPSIATRYKEHLYFGFEKLFTVP